MKRLGRRKRGTLVDETHGYLTVLFCAGVERGNRLWLTECQQWIKGVPCGSLRVVSTGALRSGQIFACEGCTAELKRAALSLAANKHAEIRRTATI